MEKNVLVLHWEPDIYIYIFGFCTFTSVLERGWGTKSVDVVDG